MRQMTETELYAWCELKQWPCGHGSNYIPGPRGGESRNVQCPVCGMQMNVMDPDGKWGRVPLGQVISEPRGYVPPAPSDAATAWAWEMKMP